MLYLDLFCAPVSAMCPKVSEKSRKASKGVILVVKLRVIKNIDLGEQNNNIMHTLGLLESTIRCTIYI